MDRPDVVGQEQRTANVWVREANHRIANQLTLLAGMIQLQIEALKKGPAQVPRQEAAEHLRNVTGRIVAIGNLHRHLASSPDALIELGPFLASTRAELMSSLSADDRITVVEDLAEGCRVTGDQASVLSLVMNELLVNALKYAHPAGEPLTMHLSCVVENGAIIVEIADDGVGLPAGFDEQRDGGVGFRLIRNLLRRVSAGLDIRSSPQGLCFRITLPSA